MPTPTTPASAPALRLLPPRHPAELPEPDASAQAVLDAADGGSNLVVVGAAGTGKTGLALHLLTRAVGRGQEAVLLSPTRARADRLRQRAAHLLPRGEGGGVVRVRTPAAFALTLLTTSLTHRPDPLPAPVLLAGAEEDAVLAQMVGAVTWPGLPPEAVTSRSFRSELRNVLARAGELGVDADQLADLGRVLGVPLWGPVSALLRTWDAQGRPTSGRRSQVRKMDTARLQDRAAEALATWDTDGVLTAPPVPDLVVVDDYQDCTAATARLLAALTQPDRDGHRAQVVVLGDPDTAVETFRGGSPSLLVEAEDDHTLAARRLHLGTRHRGVPALAALWDDQASRVPVTGTVTHRHPALGEGSTPLRPGAPVGAEALVAGSTAQEAAHVARALRAEHVHHGTPWGQMLVVTRSAGGAQALSRELRRRGVPLASSTPAVLLRAEPAASALLAAARAALEQRLGDGAGTLPERPSALDLLTSPLIGLTTLDLRRVRRALRAGQPAESEQDALLLTALSTPQQAAQAGEVLRSALLGDQAERLERAAQVLAGLRDAARPQDGAADDGPDAPLGAGVDVERLLWRAWTASGRATAWRDTALGAPRRTGAAQRRPDAVLAEAAERDLDVVTALFKRAEVWAERHPGAPAGDLLAELAGEVLPSDSVAPHGVRPDGVAVLTPAAAAGGEWEVVAVTGLGRDAWPDLRLRDSLTRSGLLVDAVTGRLPLGLDGLPSAAVDPASARAQVRGDERRMLLAALTRATRRVIATAVADTDHAPSSFLTEIGRAAGTPVLSDDGEALLAPDTGDLTLRGLVGELRHALVQGHLPGASPVEREHAAQAATHLARLAAAGVPGADPATWQGVAGPSSDTPLTEPGGRTRVSPSDVEGLTSCPLKWFLQRNGAGGPASAAQSLGDLVHALAEAAETEHLDHAQVLARFEEQLPALGYRDTWLGSVQADRARAVVQRLATYLDSVPGTASVEVPVRADLDLTDPATGATVPVTVAGRVDRLEHLDGPTSAGHGRVRVIDLKTGQHVHADPARHPQLATYRLALEATGHEVDGAALVLLGKEPPKKAAGLPVLAPPGAALDPSPDPQEGPGAEDWAATLVREAAQAASGAVLQARTGPHCRTCPVKDSCPTQPEGHRSVA